MIKLKINEEKLKTITGLKTFDPIRVLFSISDSQFDKLMTDSNFHIKPLFMLNSLYPNGMNDGVGTSELAKTCLMLGEVMTTYHMIVQNINNKNLKNLLEDIRISIQNFLIFLNFKSYYGAFTELRKVIEGILWIQEIKKDIKILNKKRIDDIKNDSYSKLVLKHIPELNILWKNLNKTVHLEKKIVCFNINDYYGVPDYIFKIVFELQKNSDIIYNKLSDVLSFFEKENSNIVNKYKKMIKKLHIENNLLNIFDGIPKENFSLKYEPEGQKLLIKIFENKEIVKVDSDQLLVRYFDGLKNINNDILHIMNEDIQNKFEVRRCIINSLHYLKNNLDNIIFSNLTIFDDSYFFKTIDVDKEYIEYTKLKNSFYEPILSEIYKIALVLFSKELTFKGNINLAILRSFVEEFIYNILLGKIECYPFINYFGEFLEKKFNYNIEPLQKFSKFRHIQKEDRIKYFNSENKQTTGNKSYILEIIEFFHLALYNIANSL